MKKTILILLAATAVSVGCVGSDSVVEPQSSGPESNETAGTVLKELTHNETLRWTHVRYGMYDNQVLDGQNCLFIDEIEEDVTLRRLNVSATWDMEGGAGYVDNRRVLELQIRKLSPTYLTEKAQFLSEMEESFLPWDPDPESDLPFYGALGWFPSTAREVHVDIEVDMTVTILYEPGESDSSLETGFNTGTCT